MVSYNMPLVIVGAFLLLTLVVGFYFSRKKTTFREHAVGHKQFSTATLVATVLATTFGGGGLVRTLEQVYILGLYWIVITVIFSSGLWVISNLSVRMGPFMQHLSMAETIGNVYGKYPRIISALVSICNCVTVITGQVIVITKAINMCVTLDDPYSIPIFATLLLIFYSAFGGVRAVTFTDVLQFITFSIVIPLLTWFMFVKVGKPISLILSFLQGYKKFQFSSIFHSDYTHLARILLLVLSAMVIYIDPGTMQRVYMCSCPRQSKKVFLYATVFSLIITIFIILISLFIFAKSPDLQAIEIWPYVVCHIPPHFKGFVAIGLLAMAMSTADSSLNACSVIVSNDIIKNPKQGTKISDKFQLKIARRTTIVVGLLAMLLAFKCQNLLTLLYWSFDCIVPLVTAPFILAVFGFRGTSHTALIGMTTGILTILAWNKWIEPSTGMNGAFIAMLANVLSMMIAHYLFKQPKDTGWVGPDDTFKQIQQENARKGADRKETIKNAWANKKITFSKMAPSPTTMVYAGLYTTITSLLVYFAVCITNHSIDLILQLFASACFIGYPFLYDISKKIRAIPKWFIGLLWFVWLAVYLPKNLIWNCWNLIDPILATSLFLTHYTIILWIFPLYLGIGVVATTLLVATYPIAIGLPFQVLYSLFPMFMAIILVFVMTIIFKVKQGRYINQVVYLKNQEKIRESQQLKASLYDAAMVPSVTIKKVQGCGTILEQVVHKIEESISFLDDHATLYKQDFQSIINKFYHWIAYFNRREKAKKHSLLEPTKITLNKLIRQVEVALSQEVVSPPKLLVEHVNDPSGKACSHVTCDINQVVYLLVQAVLRIGQLEQSSAPVVRIQLHPTVLQFAQVDPIDSSHAAFIDFPATALVLSPATTAADLLPKVKTCYADILNVTSNQWGQEVPPSIDLQLQTISTIVGAHCGYLQASVSKGLSTMLLVFPNDVMDILGMMTIALPLDSLTLDAPVTPKEQADSMMALMQFHDYACKASHQSDPIDVKTLSGLLLLLRKHFGFKRHSSGQLFYVRAVGIASLVVEWVFHSPKVVYAALLYELVRHTCLPLSYVKEHYNLGVYAFVLNVIGIDKRQDVDHHSLLYVQSRLEQAIKEEHVQLSVLFIKLAERLYDLRHATGYIHLTEVQHMAQETLTMDVQIANTYLGAEIGAALTKAANQALEVCKHKRKNTEQDKEG